MINICKVIQWNECNMVIKYDEEIVQMPSTKMKESYVYIKKIDTRFFLSNKDEYSKSLKKKDRNVVIVEDKIDRDMSDKHNL